MLLLTRINLTLTLSIRCNVFNAIINVTFIVILRDRKWEGMIFSDDDRLFNVQSTAIFVAPFNSIKSEMLCR